MISIIIPAHNEEKVIARGLHAILDKAEDNEFEIIVVCNGCTDNTAEIVKTFADQVKLIETDIASKTNALNLGDQNAYYFPRFYVDADILISADAIRETAKMLENNVYMAGSPSFKMDFAASSWLVKGYYQVWMALPYCKEGMIGTGMYALSEQGRKRFDTFPNIIADDGFIRALFTSEERISINHCYTIVKAPKTLQDLINMNVRVRLGRYELAEKFPELIPNEKKQYGYALLHLFSHISLWLWIPFYYVVNIWTRMVATKRRKKYGYKGWHKDESSRTIIAGTKNE